MSYKAGAVMSREVSQWFTPEDPAHYLAYAYWKRTGGWPEGFVPSDVHFSEGWQGRLESMSENLPPSLVRLGVEYHRYLGFFTDCRVTPLGDRFVLTHDLSPREFLIPPDPTPLELERLRIEVEASCMPVLRFARPRAAGWREARDAHLSRNAACAACGIAKALNVHHVRPFHLFPELELEPTNLLTLCEWPARNCHFVFGHLMDWGHYNVDAAADAAAYLAKRAAAV